MTPSPVYPVLQAHVKLPRLFVHCALLSQLSALDAHSSISAMIMTKGLSLGSRGALVGELGGPNYSSHSKLLVLIHIKHFHIRVCRTKIRHRDYLEHCSGNILLFSDAIIPHWSYYIPQRTETPQRTTKDLLNTAKERQRTLN